MSSLAWRRLALDIKLHNLTYVVSDIASEHEPRLFAPTGTYAPMKVRLWREKYKIKFDTPLCELPERIPRRLLRVKDDYDALIHATRSDRVYGED